MSDIFKNLEAALNGTKKKCPMCEEWVDVYKRTKTDTRHAGLWYKVRTTYCVQCDADLNHETLDSGRR